MSSAITSAGPILIARDGQVLFCKGYGMANLEHDVPCTPQTKFRLGSITKQFTAMAILILQERGKLNVTDKIKKYMPDAPKAWDDITIHHLLDSHIRHPELHLLPRFPEDPANHVTLDELIAKFKDKPLEFKPGEKFKYSNSGYIVLGQIIETASGKPLRLVLKEAIFDPLEMNDTGYDSAAQSSSTAPRATLAFSGLLRPMLSLHRHVDPSCRRCTLFDRRSICSSGTVPSTPKNSSPESRSRRCSRLFKDGYGYGWSIDRNSIRLGTSTAAASRAL